MNDANINNDCHTRILTDIVYETLTKAEQKKLAKAILGHSNLKKTAALCMCTNDTVKKAIAGMRILPETAAKIREFLNS